MEEESNSVCRSFNRVDEKTCVVVSNLESDSPDTPRDDGLALPEGFGDCQPESFTERLLHDYICSALKGVDGTVAPWR